MTDAAIEHMQDLMENQRVVEELQFAVANAPLDLGMLKSAIVEVVMKGAWARRFDTRLNSEVTFEDFRRFVTDKPLTGLGSDEGTIRRLLGGPDQCSAREAFELAWARGPGAPAGNQNAAKPTETEAESIHDNVMVCSAPSPPAEQGNSVSYAVRRLSRERPDLLAKVSGGEMSCNAAMIEAGFRKVPTPLDNMKRAWKLASEGERKEFLSWLNETL